MKLGGGGRRHDAAGALYYGCPLDTFHHERTPYKPRRRNSKTANRGRRGRSTRTTVRSRREPSERSADYSSANAGIARIPIVLMTNTETRPRETVYTLITTAAARATLFRARRLQPKDAGSR